MATKSSVYLVVLPSFQVSLFYFPLSNYQLFMESSGNDSNGVVVEFKISQENVTSLVSSGQNMKNTVTLIRRKEEKTKQDSAKNLVSRIEERKFVYFKLFQNNNS